MPRLTFEEFPLSGEQPDMVSHRPILVTGSHRSGTTWAGKMIALAPQVGYIHEPFNIRCRPGICRAKFRYWYTHIDEENEHLYRPALDETLNFNYRVASEVSAVRTFREAACMVRDYGRFHGHRWFKRRALMKDPIALFSAEWLAASFDMAVVVMIRHPAAFASSLKRKNWQFDFSNLLEQPSLMRNHLSSFETQMKGLVAQPGDIIEQAIVIWNAIHHMILRYRDRHRDWLFVRHEDLSRDPQPWFRQVFDYLELDFSSDVQKGIQRHTNPENPGEVSGVAESIRRDSKSNIWNWKQRLSEGEIERIRTNTQSLWTHFYSDADW